MKRALVLALLFACGSPIERPDGGAVGGGSGSTGGGSTGTGGGAATGGGAGGSGGSATGGGSAGGTGGTGGSGGGTVTGDAGVQGCAKATAFDPDRIRKVVVSHPFPADGGSRDNLYEVLNFSPGGELTTTNTFFRMGRGSGGEENMVFTADGRFGYVVQDDGSLGIFELGADGGVTVLDPAYRQGFYAHRLMIEETGAYLWVLDFNTPANGGGIYELALGCDGRPTNNGPTWVADIPGSAVLLPTASPSAIVAARRLGNSATGHNVHKVELAPLATQHLYRGGAAAFPDQDGIYSHVAVSPNQSWIAISDNGSFGGGDRVAFVSMMGDTLTPATVVTTPSPMGLVFSPYADAVLVVNSDSADHFRMIRRTTGTTWTVGNPLPYTNGRPQLPGQPTLMEIGMLRGRVLVPELDAIRQLRFETDGGITDVARTPASGSGNGQIIGVLGVWR